MPSLRKVELGPDQYPGFTPGDVYLLALTQPETDLISRLASHRGIKKEQAVSTILKVGLKVTGKVLPAKPN